MQRAGAIDPGFESQRLGIMLMNPGQAGYTRAQSEQFSVTRARIAAIPGVTGGIVGDEPADVRASVAER